MSVFCYTQYMFDRIHPRVRIGIVLMIAFVVSGVLFRYSTISSDSVAPTLQFHRLSDDFSQLLSNQSEQLLADISSIQLSTYTIQNSLPKTPQTTVPTSAWARISPSPFPTDVPVIIPTTQLQGKPTSTPAQAFPTDAPLPTYVQRLPTTRLPTKPPQPSVTPKPTKTPKPTRIPKPTAVVYPPITTDVRPGSSIGEVFTEAGLRACVPSALLMAIKTIETGERFKADSAASIKIYNTYGWWKSGTGNPCYGYGYHTQTGIVPSDSVNAGTRCSSAVGSPTDIGIMGLMQVSQEEETVTRKYTVKFLPNNIDRRVLFDNVLIFAIATKNRVGNAPMPSCTDWPEETVKIAAEKHHGVCVYDYGTGNAGNYCTKVWDLYKSFR